MMKLTHEDGSPPEFAIKHAAYEHGLNLVVRVLTAYCLIQGVAIIVGGEERFHGVSYRFALGTPGAPVSWGAILLLAGITIALAKATDHCTIAAFGFGIAGLWNTFFAIAFLRAALENPDANLTAMWVYGKDAFIFMIVGITLYSSTYREPRS